MESLEQEVMSMLRRLPIPITITWQSGLYHWQCAGRSGSAHRLVSAAEAALSYVLSEVAAQARILEKEEQR
jgi:hypothetical protein